MLHFKSGQKTTFGLISSVPAALCTYFVMNGNSRLFHWKVYFGILISLTVHVFPSSLVTISPVTP